MFVFNQTGLKDEGAVRRADARGAAVIFEVDMLPGNMRYQAYPSGTKAPAFTVGSDDGYAARDLIAAMPAGQPARVKATLRDAAGAEPENIARVGHAAGRDR